jgi:hypothetical protein
MAGPIINLSIKNIGPAATEDDLKRLCKEVGICPQKIELVKNAETGSEVRRAAQHAYVMCHEAEVDAAWEQLLDSELGGWFIDVEKKGTSMSNSRLRGGNHSLNDRTNGQAPKEADSLEAQIAELTSKKEKAVKDDDFVCAHICKEKIRELKFKLFKLQECTEDNLASSASCGPRMPRPQAAPPQGSRSCLGLVPGSRVKLHSLLSQPELNGCEGVCETFQVNSQRWLVRLSPSSNVNVKPGNFPRTANVKPGNLSMCSGSSP